MNREACAHTTSAYQSLLDAIWKPPSSIFAPTRGHVLKKSKSHPTLIKHLCLCVVCVCSLCLYTVLYVGTSAQQMQLSVFTSSQLSASSSQDSERKLNISSLSC